MSFYIAGTGRAEPEFILDNAMLEELVETSDEWITQRTGIKERHILREETMRSLAHHAAQEALADAGIMASELDLIVFATVGGDYRTPSQASIVSMDLGVKCPAMDLNAACTGFLYALDVADAYFQAGKASCILVVAMEIMSRFTDYSDRRTCVLFGDGGGAVVLKKGEGLKALHLSGEGNIEPLYIPNLFTPTPWRKEAPQKGTVAMKGPQVYQFAVGAFLREMDQCLSAAHLTAKDLDLIIPHQANARIIESARVKWGLPHEVFINEVARRGNTSSGSIPLLLDELNRSGRLKEGMLLALVAFGGGMTSGGAILKWQKN
ncbi:3-oxoacyl-[acyl-carrier-protein] synthase, KASIII [Clostridiaceae bacterium JG1575]|nr:3-oxoacyl-[acyl-carrier-protein] synthase, KASIII [Clostridiaceae bacterium JG1575]